MDVSSIMDVLERFSSSGPRANVALSIAGSAAALATIMLT